MDTFEIANKVEHQAIQLEKARAVLAEAYEYFIDQEDCKYLPYRAEHILTLLYVADELMQDMLPELNKTVNDLYSK